MAARYVRLPNGTRLEQIEPPGGQTHQTRESFDRVVRRVYAALDGRGRCVVGGAGRILVAGRQDNATVNLPDRFIREGGAR
jgi:hypothetical protein